nr:probable F-box protein At4g22030 [Tanacetum cinerariifolium]
MSLGTCHRGKASHVVGDCNECGSGFGGLQNAGYQLLGKSLETEQSLETVELEEEMQEITRVLEVKDKDDYLRLGDKALKLNKALVVAAPLLTSLGAVGSTFVASSPYSSWAMVLRVKGGAVGSVVNTIQHGGQVGMVFRMYRSNASFFKMMQESIESNLNERDVDSREY